jgi:hypothetical protein
MDRNETLSCLHDIADFKPYLDVNLNNILNVLKARAGTAIISGSESATSGGSVWKVDSFCSADEDVPLRFILILGGDTSTEGLVGMSSTGNGEGCEVNLGGILRWTKGILFSRSKAEDCIYFPRALHCWRPPT